MTFLLRRCPHLLCSLLLALLLVSPLAAQQESAGDETTFSGEASVLAIDLPVAVRNATGAAPGSLDPGDLVVMEDGERRSVIGVARLGSSPGAEPWRLVIYVDRVLASPATTNAAVLSLAERTEQLVALGQVEVIVANPEPVTYLAPTSDPAMVESALSRILVEQEGRGEIDALRRGMHEALRNGQARDAGLSSTELAERAVAEERAMVERSQDNLLTWAARSLGEAPRALFLISSGFDLDPGEHYRRHLEGAGGLTSSPRLLKESNEAVSRAMAAAGWVVFPLAFRDFGEGPSTSSEEFETFRRRGLDGPRGDDTAVGGFKVQLGKKKGEAEVEAARGPGANAGSTTLIEPLPPLQTLAAASGGTVIARAVGVDDLLNSLDRWYRVTFQVSRDLDGRLHPVEVRARGVGLSATSPRWVRSATPEAVSEARVRRIVGGDRAVGDLAVAARFRRVGDEGDGDGLFSGVLAVTLDLTGRGVQLPDPTRSPVRLTVAYGSEGEPPAYQHELLKAQDLSGEAWSYEKPLALPDSVEWVVVVVEELLSGTWGARDVEP